MIVCRARGKPRAVFGQGVSFRGKGNYRLIQQRLNFRPLPHGQGSLRPVLIFAIAGFNFPILVLSISVFNALVISLIMIYTFQKILILPYYQSNEIKIICQQSI